MRILFLSVLLLTSTQLNAWKIGDLFSGMSQNVTPPGAYQDQAAGYYTGGGYSMRTKRMNFQPFTATAPTLKMGGCGNIDMTMGSFSMFQGQQLVTMAKALGTQAVSYGFQLALKTFAPQIEQLLSKLRDLAMELNEFSVDDCYAVQSLFSAALPKDSAMHEDVCKDLQRQGGKDYFDSRKACDDADKARQTSAKKQAESKDEVLLDNFNLFIISAQKIKIPEDMLETTMSLTGTLIVKDGKRHFKDSLVGDADTFNAHLKGGQASMYKCQGEDKKCLEVTTLTNHKITNESSYQGLAHKKLSDIKNKMVANTGFSKPEIDYLSSLGETFPIYNYISLEVVTGLSILDKSSDLVATSMVLHYIGKVVDEIKQGLQPLEGKQINDQHFKEYLNRLDRVQNVVTKKYDLLLDRAYQTEKRARHIEQHHMSKFD